ncbi:MAG: excinuclease ABC subunit A [Flavobacteriaceae bacterium]|nr:excinuclease ABC subunit A [Flavobacteriaceae bacterium]
MSKSDIEIKGAGMHNLKELDVTIKRNKLSVITGVSGSGKSSLAFDTLYAEGQRRYVESLSSYARQFLGKLDKPKFDSINGIAPAIAIEQKVNSSNPRSTVGTVTEVYEYLKLLYARIGKTYDPSSGELIKRHTTTDIVNRVTRLAEGSKCLLLSPIVVSKEKEPNKVLALLAKQGFARIFKDGAVERIDKLENFNTFKFDLVVDRIVVNQNDEAFLNRLSSAIDDAFYQGKGIVKLLQLENDTTELFSSKFELNGRTYLEPNIHLFSFNNPFGACPKCGGYGDILGIDPELVIPDSSKSIYQGAIAPWKGEKFSWYKEQLITTSSKHKLPIHKPWFELSAAQKQKVWNGTREFIGVHRFFEELESQNYKIQNRVLLSRYRGKSICSSCQGTRLREDASFVKINTHAITDLVHLPILALHDLFSSFEFNDYERKVAERLIYEIQSRLSFLVKIGLGYLTLNRKSNTLSGGETQRINIATSLGSSLVGSMYILDEPSIGLHSKDTEQLIQILCELRDLGNTVIVVEHDEDIMKAADEIIDIGPKAGRLGGELVAQDSFDALRSSSSLTAKYLHGIEHIEIPNRRRSPKLKIEIKGARANNLKNIDVSIPLECLSVITGVSGSGKSTLARDILYPALHRAVHGHGDKPGEFSELTGALSEIKQIEFVNQNPIGRSSRSNPVTYLKIYDEIRTLYAKQRRSQLKGYKAKHFSFNVDGGRCEKCKGDGVVTIEMQFMADVNIVCDVCKGKRFKKEILEVKFHKKNISDVLDLTVDEAITFFNTHGEDKIAEKLMPLSAVGMGYICLGQSSSTLSGGEAQRIKLAYFLSKGNHKEHCLFIFDEPTTGLHFDDIKKLLYAFNQLIENGHSVLVIEHHLDLIKCADYIIDLGPDGGEQGGKVVCFGTPEEILSQNQSYTAQFLKEKLS